MNILLTGKPRVGKTTLIQKIIKEIGLSCGGFFTEELREKGERVGFAIVTLDGRKGMLSHVNGAGIHRVGRYKVNLQDLEEIGVNSLERALKENQVVVVDEIGKMELFSEKFRDIVFKILDSEKPLLGTIMLKSSSFADKIKKRKDVRLFELTYQNRDELVTTIAQLLK